MKFRTLSAAAAAAVLALSLASCSSATLPGETPTSGGGPSTAPADDGQQAHAVIDAVKADEAVVALLPKAYADAGMLQVGSNVQFPPANYYATDGKTPIGYEVDLATAIAKRLGSKVEYNDSPFENLITSLQAKRVDFTIASMNDRPDRQEKVDFVDYFKTGIGILVAAGNPDGIAAPDDLCGHTVTAGVASSQAAWATKQSDQCLADGKKAIEVVESNNDQQRLNSVRTGRVTAELNDLANLVYVAETAGGGKHFEVVNTEPLEGALYGLGVNKETPELRDAIQASLQSLIDDGTYLKILDAWKLQAGAVTEASINAGQ